MNFIGNLQAVDNSGNTSTDVSLKPDVTGLTSLGIANSSTTASNLTSTANGNFTTGAGTGFYYGGATGSLVGANTISSTGAFTGTLFALTADSTATGTILGISGQNLSTGKAIDVSLGAAYNLTGNDTSGKAAGAVNIRAGAYNGNIFNVLSTANTGSTTMNLANLQSGQTDGQLLKIYTTGTYAGTAGTGILNIDANTATGGTVARITATSLTGASQGLSIALGAGSASTTAILVNSSSAFAGNLIDLQSNSGSQFKVDATNTTVAGNLLGSNASGFSIDATSATALKLGTTTGTGTVNISRATQTTAIGGNATVVGTTISGGTLTVTGTTPSNALVVSGSTGNLTAQGLGTFGPNAGNQLIVQGAATGTGVQLRSIGSSDANVAISIAPSGTGRVTIVGGSGGLDVENTIVAGSTKTNKLTLAGSATTVPVSLTATGLDTNISIQLVPKGAGALLGPATAAFLIDVPPPPASAQQITIGGTSATQVDIARSGILTRILGSATVGSSLGVTGDFSVNSTKFTANATSGNVAFLGDLAINGTKFTVAASTGDTVMAGALTGSNATAFLIDSSATLPLKLGTASTTTSVTISRSGQTTTVAGLLVVTGSATFNGTVQVGSTGTALTEIRTGTCSVANTSITKNATTVTACTIIGTPNLQAFTIFVSPQSAPPTGISWTVDFPSTTAINIRWDNPGAANINSTAITFNWTAVR